MAGHAVLKWREKERFSLNKIYRIKKFTQMEMSKIILLLSFHFTQL